jgi:hypothetical protein
MTTKRPARKRSKGKQKGSAFERKICKHLSLWVSKGKDEDLFWRSAMSGGRATVHARKKGGKLQRRHAGDISATSAEGCSLTDRFFIECKSYKNLDLLAFLFKKSGKLYGFWEEAIAQADKYGKQPVLIGKQNYVDEFVIMYAGTFRSLSEKVPILFRCRKVEIVRFEDLIASNYREHADARFPRELGLP